MSGRPPPPRTSARPPPKRGAPPTKRTSMPPKARAGGPPSSSPVPPEASSRAPPTKIASKRSSSMPAKDLAGAGGSAGGSSGSGVTKSAAAAALSAHLVKKSAGEVSPPKSSPSGSPPSGPPPSAPSGAAPTKKAALPTVPVPTAGIRERPIASEPPPPADEHKMEMISYDSSAEAVDGFLDGEREYVEHLQQGYLTFLKRLEVHVKFKKAILDSDQILELFGNYYTIYNANDGLFKDLNALRKKGLTELQNGLGKTMIQFIPYLRVYTDYIVKKDQRQELLESLKTSTKKFRDFVKINEAVIERKLKKVLQEPVERLVKYLSGMGAIYSAWEKEVGSDAIKEIEEAQKLFKAIVDVKQVTDEISEKCKDTKARRELGMLQTKVFGDKILLIAAHRLCMKWADVKMIKKGKSLVDIVLILCNDILIVGQRGSRFKGGAMLAVFPLIGLRIVLTPSIDSSLTPESLAGDPKIKSLDHRFAIIPQNTKFTPAESSGLSSIVIIVPSANELNKWVRLVEDSVDEEEHNLRPTNPVDLEKRLRKEKTSVEGMQDKIQITDPDKIAAIEEWKVSRGGHRRRASKLTGGASSSIPSFSPGGSDLKSRPAGSSAPSGAAPSAKAPSKPGAGHKKTSSMSSAPTAALISGMMKDGGPRLQSASVTATVPPKKKDSRSSLMAGIQGFKAGGLKSVTEEDRRSSVSRSSSLAPEQPQDMASLLQNTLANYRTYVQDDDEDDDGSGSDWE